MVAFPTDTVYGLGADPFNEAALWSIYEAKGRPEEKPIALLVSTFEDLRRVTAEVPPLAERLIERFWPGPLTVVVPASPELPKVLLAGRETVGVRMPDHPLALRLLQSFGGPLAVTSANLSGEPDLCTAEAVEAALGGRVPMILDGGRTPGGAPSTVLDLSTTPPRLLREGPISREQFAQACSFDILALEVK